MATKYSTYILHCQTSIHAGDGTSTGTIDMPIQRERTTGFPVLRDSTTRGSIREHFETPLLPNLKKLKKKTSDNNVETALTNDEKTALKNFHATFGYRENGDKASAISVLPARLLFFPVRSFKGVFAYVTCPFILKRFIKEMKLFYPEKSIDIQQESLQVAENEAHASANLKINDTTIGLEEFLFEVKDESFDLKPILELFDKENTINRLEEHIAIINDTQFAYFTRLFTEKVTRNKINIEKGVADDTGLFNEEFLQEESILYTTFGFANEFSDKKERLTDKDLQTYFDTNFTSLFQLGGDKSVGKGLINPYKLDIELSKTVTE